MGKDRGRGRGCERQDTEHDATMSGGHRHHRKRCKQWKTDHRAQCGAEHFEPSRSWRQTSPCDEQDNEPR
jgi:hypothetical protein